jgi:hypothetical protein
MGDNPSAKYLFDFVTGAMSIVLALIFEKVGEGIATLRGSWDPSKTLSAWEVDPALIGTIIVLTGLLILVGVIVTLSYIHNDLGLPYLRFYFLFDLIFAALCLFTAVICVQKAVPEPSNTGINLTLLTFAMHMLTLTFIALTVRGWLTIQGASLSSGLRRSYYHSILPFHLGGIILTLWAGFAPQSIAVLAALGFVGSLGYLLLQWALQVRLAVSLVDRPPTTG